jgi:hypothetical protein
MPALFFRATQRGTLSTDLTTFQDISELSVGVNFAETRIIDVTLVVPDTWNRGSRSGTNFAIAVETARSGGPRPVVEGLYTGTADQRIPFAIQYVGSIRSGPTRIVAQWKTRPEGIAQIGSSQSATLKIYVYRESEVALDTNRRIRETVQKPGRVSRTGTRAVRGSRAGR